MFASTRTKEPHLGRAISACVILWTVYTILFTLPLPEIWHSIIDPLPGLIGVTLLLVVGFRNGNWYLRIAPLSKIGMAILGAMCLILLAPLVPALLEGTPIAYRGLWPHLSALTSGVAQELFFRAVLLPVCILGLGGRRLSGTVLQAILFGLWHVPRAYLTAPVTPWLGALLVGAVTTIAGLGWGWQVQRDRTIIWALVQHIIFLFIMSLFGL